MKLLAAPTPPWVPNATPALPGVTAQQLNTFWGYAEGIGLVIAFFAFVIAAIVALLQWKGRSVAEGEGMGRMPKILFLVCMISLAPTIITTVYSAMG